MAHPREIAIQVLEQVETREAYAHLALPALLRKNRLPAADRRLATELAYGALRQRGLIDWVLGAFLRSPLQRLEPRLRQVLRVATYEILFMSYAPMPVIVHDVVELARRTGNEGGARLANAVLRQVAGHRDHPPLPDPEREPGLYLSVKHSHPRWMVERWLRLWGWEETEALCAANNAPPPITARANLMKIARDQLLTAWLQAGMKVEPCRWSPDGVMVRSGGDVRSWPGYRQGWFTVQDESAMLAARFLDPQPGEWVLDLCSAPGAKTTHLGERMRNRGSLVAADLRPGRLLLVRRAWKQLGLRRVHLVAGDGRQVDRWLRVRVHRCLVDAPCSGTGTLRRRPDARWHKQADQPRQLMALQMDLLTAAARTLRPGGVLVYTTCTLEPEENEEVAEALLQTHPELEPDLAVPAGLEHLQSELQPTGLRLFPHRHGTDGFYLMRWRKRLAGPTASWAPLPQPGRS